MNVLPILLGLAAGAAVLISRKKDASASDNGPLTTEPPPSDDGASAGDAAADALRKAQEAAAAATAAADAAIRQQAALAAQLAAAEAARAAAAAAGTPAAPGAAAAANDAVRIAIDTATRAGLPPPPIQPGAIPTAPPVPTKPPEVTVIPPITNSSPGQPTARPTGVLPPVTLPIPTQIEVPPITIVETTPDADPNGTVRLARSMLDAEDQPGWKRVEPDVAAWQSRVGLTSDGKFGPKSALTMGSEVGVLPLVRFWPKGSQKSAVLKKYRNDLATLAAIQAEKGRPAHSAALLASAQTEQAQSYGVTNPKPASDRLQLLQQLLKAAV